MDWFRLLAALFAGGAAVALCGAASRHLFPGPERAHVRAAISVVGVVFALGLAEGPFRERAAWAIEDAIAPVLYRDPFDRIVYRLTRRMREVPELRAWLREETARGMSRHDVGAEGQKLASRGALRLDRTRLLTRAQVMGQLLAASDVATCAAISRGSASPDQLASAFAQLPPPAVDSWVQVSAAAMQAELRKESPLHPPGRAEAEAALRALLAALPLLDGERLANDLQTTTALTDAEACWMLRTISAKATTLEDPQRTTLLQLLTGGVRG